MLDPEYILRMSEGAEQIAEELHNEIIAKIVDRIMARLGRGEDYILTPLDKWQIEVLQDAGYLAEDIQKVLAEKTRLQTTEIKEAFEDAGVESTKYDDAIYRQAGLSPVALEQSPYLVRLMQRNFEKTLGEWENFTGTFAEESQKLFIRECDRAYNLVASGAMSHTQAVREALERIVEGGVTVEYPSGHSDTIETATLRCVRTGIAQASGEITLERMKEMDWDIVLVSAHLGARVTDAEDFANHFWWQGKFYSRSGRDKRFPPFSVCGLGDVQGLHGANCRHSFGAGDGIHNPYKEYDSEENRKAYELSQRQRTLERRIRKTKREVMGLKEAVDKAPDEATKAEVEETYQKKSLLLQKQNKAYNDFCAENNLKKQADRISIAKWNRKQAAQARGAARKSKNSSAPGDIQEAFSVNSTGGEKEAAKLFDIDAENKKYSEFLTTVPEKNRMYLEQSFNAVEYKKREMNNKIFGYSRKDDCIYYDPTKPEIFDYDYNVVNTHELSHRIDHMFVESWKNKDFTNAILDAKQAALKNAKTIKNFCLKNDTRGFTSDIVSAITDNEIKANFGHSEEYWAKASKKEKEVFADMFSILSMGDTLGMDFIKTQFPQIHGVFTIMFEGM